MKTPPKSRTGSGNSEPTQDKVKDNPDRPLEPSGEEQKEGEGLNVEPGVEYLSCAGIQLVNTVWSTIQQAAALKGKGTV